MRSWFICYVLSVLQQAPTSYHSGSTDVSIQFMVAFVNGRINCYVQHNFRRVGSEFYFSCDFKRHRKRTTTCTSELYVRDWNEEQRYWSNGHRTDPNTFHLTGVVCVKRFWNSIGSNGVWEYFGTKNNNTSMCRNYTSGLDEMVVRYARIVSCDLCAITRWLVQSRVGTERSAGESYPSKFRHRSYVRIAIFCRFRTFLRRRSMSRQCKSRVDFVVNHYNGRIYENAKLE